jgi:hypothetical protein
MTNKIGSILVTALGVVLLIYSASRSLDFISLTLPADKQILAWFGLAALDGGLVAWLLSYLYGSNGGWQRAIAMLMIVVDFLGAVAMFTLDTLYNAGTSGLVASMSAGAIQSAVLALSGVIAINIGATVAHHMLDPEMMRRQAEETARALIEDQAIQLIHTNSRQLAGEIAPQVASAWRDGIALEYGHRLRKPKALPAQASALPALAEDDSALPAQAPTPNPTRRRRSKPD